MELSIIIITYNQIKYICQCLDSLANIISRVDVEVIVVDNGSSDGTCQFLRENYPLVTIIENNSNYGVAYARNRGFEVACGRKLLILDNDTMETLHDKLSILGKELLLDTLPSIIDGFVIRIKQDEKEVTYAYNIKREEEYLDFHKTSRELYNQIRGLSPFPGSSCFIGDKEFKVYFARIEKVDTSMKIPGEVLHIYKDGIGIATKDYELVLLDIKPSGKKRMLASSFINGIKKSDYLGKVAYETKEG